MNDSYTTIRVSGTGEYIEKKSKFIGEVHFAKTLPEAEAFLQAARKRYYDARHHGSLTPELPESPEGALFFAQILKLHIAYMRIYGV